MTVPFDRKDPEVEGRLRALLTERAATITGPPPALPEIAVDELAVAARPPRHRWVVAAVTVAAGVLLLGGIAAVVDDDPAPQQVRTTQPADALANLPDGFDPLTAPAVFQVQGNASATDIAKRYLGRRLGDLDTRPEDIVAELEFDAGAADGAIVPVTWRHRNGASGSGTVLVKLGKGRGVIAATTPGVDLGDVHYEQSVLTGHVARTDQDLPGRALVDVLPFGDPFATFGHAPPPANATAGYGSTAKGDQAFAVDTGEMDPIVTVRFAADGAVRAISEVAFHAPDDPSNDPPDLANLTDEERQQVLDEPLPPPCATAATDLDPLLTHAFPGGEGTAPRTRAADDVFRESQGDTPAAAVAQLGDDLGVPLEAVTSAAPMDGDVAVGARSGDVAVLVHAWPHDGVWSAAEATTPAACWSLGAGNLTPLGDPHPRTRLELSTIAGARSGQFWYRDEDGATWTIALDADDFARRNIAVDGEYDTIKRTALVARDADGRVVLVQKTSRG